MNLHVYEILHVFGIMLAFLAIGGLTLRALDGGTGDGGRKLALITHGVAMLVIPIAGFGMLAKLKLGLDLWVWLKVAIWIVLAALPVLIKHQPQHARIYWLAVPILGAFAAYLGIYKPF